MLRVVAAQFLTSVVVAAGAWMAAGHRAAISALLGGLACAVPNGLFALNLAGLRHLSKLRSDRPPAGSPGMATALAIATVFGEFVKVAMTIGLLALIARAYKDLVWPALIVSLSAVLLMQAAALLRR